MTGYMVFFLRRYAVASTGGWIHMRTGYYSFTDARQRVWMDGSLPISEGFSPQPEIMELDRRIALYVSALCRCSLDAIAAGQPGSNRFVEELQKEPGNEDNQWEDNKNPRKNDGRSRMSGPGIPG